MDRHQIEPYSGKWAELERLYKKQIEPSIYFWNTTQWSSLNTDNT